MSTSASGSALVQGGYYTEVHVDFKKVKGPGVDRMVPILQELTIEGKEGTNPSSQAIVDNLRERGVKVETLPIHWKGMGESEVRAQLAPMRAHYLTQILLVRERTTRCGIENEEFAARSNIQVAYQYTTPLKQRLLNHWASTKISSKMFCEQLSSSESLGSSCIGPESVNTSIILNPTTPQSAQGCKGDLGAAPMHQSSRPPLHDATTTTNNSSFAASPLSVPQEDAALRETLASLEETLNRMLETTQTPSKSSVGEPSQSDVTTPFVIRPPTSSLGNGDAGSTAFSSAIKSIAESRESYNGIKMDAEEL